MTDFSPMSSLSQTLSFYDERYVGAASNPDNTESNLYTYDIMIRHCFGNYFDILKEMTYSPKMGEQFSYVESSSTRIAWDTSGEMVFPDENYAREVRFITHHTFGPGFILSNINCYYFVLTGNAALHNRAA